MVILAIWGIYNQRKQQLETPAPDLLYKSMMFFYSSILFMSFSMDLYSFLLCGLSIEAKIWYLLNFEWDMHWISVYVVLFFR